MTFLKEWGKTMVEGLMWIVFVAATFAVCIGVLFALKAVIERVPFWATYVGVAILMFLVCSAVATLDKMHRGSDK